MNSDALVYLQYKFAVAVHDAQMNGIRAEIGLLITDIMQLSGVQGGGTQLGYFNQELPTNNNIFEERVFSVDMGIN